MITARDHLATEANSQEATELLHRILVALQEPRAERQRWAELMCATVLALATMASAWCAFQATLWNGVQTFRLGASARAGREASKHAVTGMQVRAFDATMFLHYLEARAQGHKNLEELLYRRFPPEMKVAVNAWLETKPLENPQAPLHPLKMKEYVVPAEIEAGKQAEIEKEMIAVAEDANQNSDRYVLLTVMFASVLFLGGIAGTVHLPRLRQSLGILAVTVFMATVAFLATMPLCRE